MKSPRWTVVSPSAYEWEREALEFLREHLPDHEPWRAWSNFEFVDDEGRVNEVDLLVLAPSGLRSSKSKVGRARSMATRIAGFGRRMAAGTRSTIPFCWPTGRQSVLHLC